MIFGRIANIEKLIQRMEIRNFCFESMLWMRSSNFQFPFEGVTIILYEESGEWIADYLYMMGIEAQSERDGKKNARSMQQLGSVVLTDN
jgi:hypothetical protein